MTSNLKHSLRSLRLGLALIFTLFMAVASWAAAPTDVIYTYSMSWKENGLRYTGTITSNTGKISNNFSSDNRADYVLLKGNESASVSEDDFSIEFACFRDVYKGSSNNSFRVTHSDAKITITINNKNNNSYKIRKVTIKNSKGEEINSVTHVTTLSKTSIALLPNIEFSTIVVELTNKPYYSVTPAEGFAIVNTDGFVVDGTAYFHPNTSITIAPTSAVQLITKVTTPTTGATIASDKRSFSFAMPQSNITPSATLEEAHSVALTGNVSISEPLFTDGDTRYYKSGDLITITAKTNELIDGITGIENCTIAADQKSATFTMPTSDLTLAVATSEVHTMSVPSGMTLSDPYITIGDVKYYKKGETYTLTAPQYNIIDGFTATGAQSSSVSSDKRSATVTIGSANVTATATLYEVHTMNIAGGMTLSPPFITIAGVKYYRKGGTYTFTAPTYNIIESFTATGALSSTISADKRTAKVTVGTANVTTTASLTEVHTLSVPEGMTLSDPYTTIAGVKYYKRGETYTFTAPEYNIIEGFTATGAQSSSVSDDKRLATVTVGKADVTTTASLTEVHTVTAQDGITLSEAYTNILGTDYYKYGQEVTFGFSGSGSVAYYVDGVRIEGNSVTVGHENLTVQMDVSYIDENGKEQVRKPGEYTVLTKNTLVSNLPAGWYVVLGKVSYTKTVEFSKDAYLILADGAKMEIETEGESENGIYASKNLTIYGQSGQSGILKASAKGSDCFGIYSIFGNVTISGGSVTSTSEKGNGIYGSKGVTISGGSVTATGGKIGIFGYDGVSVSGGSVTAAGEKDYGIISSNGVTISGGSVTATGGKRGIYGSNGVTISGGSVTATGEEGNGIFCYNGVTISGGTVSATSEKGNGIYADNGNITLSWAKSTDAVKASSYRLGDSEKHVIIADGKSFTDEDGNVYSGTLNDDQLSAIKGKTLTPAPVKYIDENGEEKSVVDYTVLTSTTDVSNLPGGWYVVQGEVSYTNTVKFSDDAYLILADGAKMEIESAGDGYNAIYALGNLTIYGQSGQSGILKASAKGLVSVAYGIRCLGNVLVSGGTVVATTTGNTSAGISVDKNITISGGTVAATATGSNSRGIDVKQDITISGGDVTVVSEKYEGIYGGKNITISGGSVTATSESGDGIYCNGNVTISGGTVTATSEDGSFGIYGYNEVTISGGIVTTGNDIRCSYGNISLSWTNLTDKIKAKAYYAYDGNVIIAAGKSFTDEDGKVYSGTLNDDQLSAIKGKTLTPAPVKYIDENGEEKSIYEYTVLTSTTDVSNLPGGWYVVLDEVGYTNTVTFSGDAYLILADGAKIEIETEGNFENGITVSENLTIYGQSGQRGILKTTVKGFGGSGIYGGRNITISGGTVTATSENGSGIYSYKGITISGGTVTATSENGSYSYKGVTISGGTVTATGNNYGIYANSGNISLSWTNSTDAVKASNYYSEKGSVVVAEGKYFTDENGRVYSGTLSDNQIAAISHQTIEPLPWKNLGDYAAVQIFEDENGKKHAVIDGEYEGTETVDIPNEIAVDAVDYIRDFDANTPSTVLMPVRLPSCATVNAKFYKLDEVYQSGYRWVAKVQNIGKALPQANTAYAVMLPTAGKLEFNFEGCATAEEKQAIVQTGEIQTSGNTDGSWYFTGTYAFKRWTETENKDEVGLVYGFAGSNEDGIAKGQFGRVDFGAHANPLRCYLRKKDDSVVLKAQTLAKAAPQVLKAAPYSISLLPETIDVEFVDEDENGEHTTAIGRMDTRTGKIRLLRTDRTYDLKGRRVNDVNRAAKGAYYGKKF